MGSRLSRLLFGLRFLEIANQQLELVDPLRGAAEAGAPHQRERRPQLLDVERLGMELGASAGYGTIGAAPPVLALILGFGVSALLYLVTEELLLEAHETRDTPLITATFLLGFLTPLILAQL